MLCYFKLVNNNKCVMVLLNKGDGEFTPPKLVLGDFGYHAGVWRVDKHLRFLTNINDTCIFDIIRFKDQQNLSLLTFATTMAGTSLSIHSSLQT